MLPSETPCLSIAIARMSTSVANHFATWVVQSPDWNGYVHHDSSWPDPLSQTWQAWLELFSPHSIPNRLCSPPTRNLALIATSDSGRQLSYSTRLMQQLGINLWQWLFQGSIQASLHRSQGIAIGQDQPLRIRLDLRDADLIPIPWETMQPQAGQPAISLSQNLWFSRTTFDVNPLPQRVAAQGLNILLILGENQIDTGVVEQASYLLKLKLEEEAIALSKAFEQCSLAPPGNQIDTQVSCGIKTLIQPTVEHLIAELETDRYNVLFYAGHGVPAPDGGLLFLRPDTTVNGTELAQVLVRCGIVLAVFNTCWSAQPAVEAVSTASNSLFQAIPSSSLAKVLIHHGVPAVLGMRDSITDAEALSFIQAFARALGERLPVDQAVAVARQQLLALYKFNQPAWTLPILYMHPEFDGVLVQPLEQIKTEMPNTAVTGFGDIPRAWLRLMSSVGNTPVQAWPVDTGLVRVGRGEGNDVIVSEQWVSSKHAEIFCRHSSDGKTQPNYFLRDFSRYGTLVFNAQQWQRIHHQEIPLISGMQLKFGSSQGQMLEFIIEAQYQQ
ncbi:CHAT domain-containing protein [Planktothrix pseudagardhii]|uniref:FHA domain containing protein n=1 Tax=Planktothrix pseudagardhii TaxID=132604 RepID=A0A9W4CR08_9CYAN|nr:CHAT domain-containing protein [Planktothrix pseudagardhii]CAD5976342.1 FHA domain containing protein [Planktothrix pseudagardhii]